MFRIRSLFSVVFILTGCGLTHGKPAAEKAIAHFHDLLNDGKSDEIWTSADPSLRSSAKRQDYDSLMGAIQRKLGRVTATTNVGWNVRTFNLTTTVELTQETGFERGHGRELFTFVMQGTNAVLAGYHIQSIDMMTR